MPLRQPVSCGNVRLNETVHDSLGLKQSIAQHWHACFAFLHAYFSPLFSRYGSAPTCVGCPAGRFFVASGARLEADCGNCPLGRYGDQTGQKSLAGCKGCAAGKRGKSGGQPNEAAGCSDCEAGSSYQDQTGMTACKSFVCDKVRVGRERVLKYVVE